MHEGTRAILLTALVGTVAGSSLALAPSAPAQDPIWSETFLEGDSPHQATRWDPSLEVTDLESKHLSASRSRPD